MSSLPLDPTTFPLTGQHLIEASAGTGKTYTITNLYLRLLLGRDPQLEKPLSVDQILVLTFTIAATEELRDRIRSRINEAKLALLTESRDPFLQWIVDGSEDRSRDVRLLTAATQLMDEASIFTIHGFCARVLSDNAFETGMLFDQSLDADRDELLEQAARDCFRAYVMSLEEIHRGVALDMWPSPDKLIAATRSFLFRESLTLMPAENSVDDSGLREKIQQLKDAWIEEDFENILDTNGFSKASKSYKHREAMTAWCRSEAYEFESLDQFSTAVLDRNLNKTGTWPQSAVPTLVDEILESQAAVRINLWHSAIRRIRENLVRYKIEQSKLTLDDLLTEVRAAQQSAGGRRLSSSLASRWPIALVDEFQDTDDVQWGIFSHIWQHEGIGLLLIGDPKQAIYQFRGADVFTYINAKRSIDSHYSLDTNWRSRTDLVEATNTLFSRTIGVFGNDDDIPFVPVNASPNADQLTMTTGGVDVAPVSMFSVPFANKNQVRRIAMSKAADETSKLLSGSRGEVLINGEPIHAGQIAFLVRDRHDAKAARDALAERNIRSVYVTLESVFLNETADDLRHILHAVLEPTNLSALRAALSTRLMQQTARDIEALNTDIDVQQRTFREFADYHRQWSEMDVATMISALMQRREIPQKWYAQPDGERQLTNLRHLTELLQQRASVAPGMHRLFKWFSREKYEANTVAVDDRQLRLESDRDLVKIVTMHAAKGLQYEVVMIPMGTFGGSRSQRPYLIHNERDGHFETVLQLADDDEARDASWQEQQAEDMRLLYVAMTRARHQCYLGVPLHRGANNSAAGRLLGTKDDGWREQWPQPHFVIEDVDHVDVTAWQPSAGDKALVAPPPAPAIPRGWRVHSYTGVMRRLDTDDDVEGNTQPGFGDDDRPDPDSTPLRETRSHTRFAFPRGPRVGVALHSLMEHLDFGQSAAEQQLLVSQCLDRVGITADRDRWESTLIEWVDDILATPISDFSLADVTADRRLDEMEFHFPLTTADNVFEAITAAGYANGRQLRTPAFEGLMTGMIDLVFEHEGRFWVVDYKSNHLGDSAADYAGSHLKGAMNHHLYDLQYLIYSVALHRYLRARVSNYTYESHFGGIAYLFLRGMQGQAGTGVFLDRPDAKLIDDLSAALAGRPVA